MDFLYNNFEGSIVQKLIGQVVVPSCISDNLKQKYGERKYQSEAFRRFIYLFNNDFDEKPPKPLHLLYNMATGSGKTLIMAGLILYLYEQGYRNFLFFVNSNNIIRKTRDNFLNDQSSKYLFREKIMIDGREVCISEAENFEDADANNINIKFTTIQQLHIDLTNAKENSITYEDFKDKRTVLIADEAHHLNSATKNNDSNAENWENTVLQVLRQNDENILLEFTATLDYESAEISKKYRDKVIFKYDLAQFRTDKYSKEIELLRSMYDERERIIQALVLNLYRSELAAKYNINLKPVILFKAKSRIEESEQNKINFHNLVDELSPEMIKDIRDTSSIAPVQDAFIFFSKTGISDNEISRRIKFNFRPENCISANNDKEAERNQILLNTLEDENNPIRAVFAVQKLNEGWDVLNLFDIVRLYEGRNSGGTNKTVGKTTLSEAQLIGRGARYFPFVTMEEQDRFTRKYDREPDNELKILEELYYHTRDESKYISELKKALIMEGLIDDENDIMKLQLNFKPSFKSSSLYRDGEVFLNKRIRKSYKNIRSLSGLGVAKRNYDYRLSSGSGSVSVAFSKDDEDTIQKNKSISILLKNIPQHIIRFAISQNPYFHFDRLEKFGLNSLSEFISHPEFLAGMAIKFTGSPERVLQITHKDYLCAVRLLLNEIESEIKANTFEYEGSDYVSEPVKNIFREKEIKIQKSKEKSSEEIHWVRNEEWYAYDVIYGTSEETDFVRLFAEKFEAIREKFDDIYLVRNENELKIIDKQGRAFEPDFVLFCKRKDEEATSYQVFIEPKGWFLQSYDGWKNDFLKEIKAEKKTIKIDSDHYLITAVPFYNSRTQNEFKKEMDETLKL